MELREAGEEEIPKHGKARKSACIGKENHFRRKEGRVMTQATEGKRDIPRGKKLSCHKPNQYDGSVESRTSGDEI